MARQNEQPQKAKKRAPARTPEEREQQLVLKAYQRAEKQIEDGSVSSQVLTHFLKMGSSREFIEQEIKRKEGALLDAKVEAIAAAGRIESLFEDALEAMRSYKGGLNSESE